MTAWTPSRVIRGIRKYLPSVVFDGLIVIASFALALALRFGGYIPDFYLYYWFPFAAPALAVIYCGFNIVFNTYRRVWRFAGIRDLLDIGKSVVSSTAFFLVAQVVFFRKEHPIPTSAVLIGGGITLIAFGMTKMAVRLRQVLAASGPSSAANRMLIAGAGYTGQLLASQLLQNRIWDYKPVCFVDDDVKKHGLRIHGVPVMGSRSSIPALVKRFNIDTIAIAISSDNGEEIRDIISICQNAPAKLLIVPSVAELLQGKGDPETLREVQVDDLLGREAIKMDFSSCSGCIAGKRVPTTRPWSGTSLLTTAPAPTMANRPTVTPGRTIAPAPTDAPSFTSTPASAQSLFLFNSPD